MSIKIRDLNREQIEKLIAENDMLPVYNGQNPYIASGPEYEIFACLMPDGLYQVELLDKLQVEKSLQHTIKVFKEYAESSKSR